MRKTIHHMYPDRQEKKANQNKPPKTFDAFILPSHE
jgi:hypothetical protein